MRGANIKSDLIEGDNIQTIQRVLDLFDSENLPYVILDQEAMGNAIVIEVTWGAGNVSWVYIGIGRADRPGGFYVFLSEQLRIGSGVCGTKYASRYVCP